MNHSIITSNDLLFEIDASTWVGPWAVLYDKSSNGSIIAARHLYNLKMEDFDWYSFGYGRLSNEDIILIKRFLALEIFL